MDVRESYSFKILKFYHTLLHFSSTFCTFLYFLVQNTILGYFFVIKPENMFTNDKVSHFPKHSYLPLLAKQNIPRQENLVGG